MFITRKQLEEEKTKAVNEIQEKMWLIERVEVLERKMVEVESSLRVLECSQDKICDVDGVTNGL